MTDLAKASRWTLPGQRRPEPADAGGSVRFTFIDLPGLLAGVETLRRELACGDVHAHSLPAPGAAVSGIRSGADRQ